LEYEEPWRSGKDLVNAVQDTGLEVATREVQLGRGEVERCQGVEGGGLDFYVTLEPVDTVFRRTLIP
jgi:hypothetical protein